MADDTVQVNFLVASVAYIVLERMGLSLPKYEEEYEPKLARLISDLIERQGVTEELRSQNWLEYVQRGTAAHSQAWELMREEIQS